METNKTHFYPDGRLDTQNAAKYIGVSVKTLAQWRTQGKGPKFIKRGRVFYYRKDIDEWLTEDGLLQSTTQSKGLRLNLK